MITQPNTNVIPASERFTRGSQATKPEAANDEFKRHLSFGTDAINHLLVAANCPEKYRSYIDCIVGMSGGAIEFEASDAEVAKRIRPSEEPNLEGDKKWLKDKRRSFEQWQNRSGFVLIERTPGGYDQGSNTESKIPRKTHYGLPLLSYVKRVIKAAQKNVLMWADDPLAAIEKEASALIRGLPLVPYIGDGIGRASTFPWPIQIKGLFKASHSYLLWANRVLPPDAELYGQLRDLVEMINEEAAKLTDRFQ